MILHNNMTWLLCPVWAALQFSAFDSFVTVVLI